MKVVQINITSSIGSTGKIAVAISDELSASAIENYIFYVGKPDGTRTNAISYMSDLQIKKNALYSRISGRYGLNAIRETSCLIEKLNTIRPDIIHLHNLHGHNCNLELLFDYIKKNNIKVIWTFHDCWAFTAYCPHYEMNGCGKWKTGCEKCPVWKKYSWFIDRSRELYARKKEVLSDIDMTIVTPSSWLAEQVKQSYLSGYDIKVINNGIDLNIFKPIESDFRKTYNIENKFIVLGVAHKWNVSKGLDIFIELSKQLDKDNCIVLVGTDEKIDKQLPDNIISIHRTQNQQELAQIYSTADVFVNPTREDTFPTVNIEALACGTPVITFDTGGSPEIIDNSCGVVIKKDDIHQLHARINRLKETKDVSKLDCLKRASEFDKKDKFKEYIDLYLAIEGKKDAKN